MPSAVGISASRRATNQVIAHAPPMRRTVRRTLRVAPALTLRAHVSDARNHGRRDCIHLALELENGTTSPWIDVGVREVQVSAYGCIAKRVCFQGPSFDPSYDEAVLGETLRTGDELALLYRITTLDPLRAVDGNSDVHHATRTGSSWPDTVGSAVMVVAVDAMLVFRGAVSTNAVESRIPLACRWKCAMNADGVLEVRRAGTMEDEESSAARAMRQHQHRPSISSGMLSEEGLSIAVAVNGAGLGSSASENIAAHGVHLNRIFALHVEVVNRCRHSRKLAVCLLGGNIIGAGASLRERWSNKDKRVAMSAVGLLEVFDDHQRRDTSFISLETDVVLPQLDPGRSTMGRPW